MSNPEIKNRWTGETIIAAGKYADIKTAVAAEKADLSGSNLREART